MFADILLNHQPLLRSPCACDPFPCVAVRCSAMWCDVVRRDAARSAVRCAVAWCGISAAQCGVVPPVRQRHCRALVIHTPRRFRALAASGCCHSSKGLALPWCPTTMAAGAVGTFSLLRCLQTCSQTRSRVSSVPDADRQRDVLESWLDVVQDMWLAVLEFSGNQARTIMLDGGRYAKA